MIARKCTYCDGEAVSMLVIKSIAVRVFPREGRNPVYWRKTGEAYLCTKCWHKLMRFLLSLGGDKGEGKS